MLGIMTVTPLYSSKTSSCRAQTPYSNLSVGRTLGIVVEPALVRLIPNADNGYIWLRQPEREHLFMKQLSKHSYGVYKQLCREVGISIEAVARPVSTNEAPERGTGVCSSYFALRLY